MIKILVNDGIHPDGKSMLENAKYQVNTEKIDQEKLPALLPQYDAIVVRSATKVRKDLIDKCPNLKIISRGGVGLDNIDVEYAKSKGIKVINTPAASSRSVAELAFAHMFTLSRFLHKSNQAMPGKGDTQFKNLKKSYAKGAQLLGKNLGIIGLGRIGQETAKLGLAIGMEVYAVDPMIKEAKLDIKMVGATVNVKLPTVSMDTMLANADFLSLHIPFTGKAVLGPDEFAKMKDGLVLINAARGGTVDEDALLAALNSGKVAAAGLDVFANEPTPRKDLLAHPNVSLTPHIGASTLEAQRNIGLELADQLIAHFGSN